MRKCCSCSIKFYMWYCVDGVHFFYFSFICIYYTVIDKIDLITKLELIVLNLTRKFVKIN